MIWDCMTTFGPEAWYKIEDMMDQHMVYNPALQYGSKEVGVSTR